MFINDITGGGLIVYVNNRWCTNFNIVSTVCTPDIECLILNCRPFYLPREITNIFIAAVYIPPSADKVKSLDYLYNEFHRLCLSKPNSVQLIFGDFNQCNLKSVLPNLHQYINFSTRGDNTLDHFYSNVNHAFRAVKLSPLKNSDHNMIYMKPLYKTKVEQNKTVLSYRKIYTSESLEELKACFESTDWKMFIDNCESLSLLVDTISSYIMFCSDNIIPVKQKKTYANNKPWLNNEVCVLIKQKHRDFKNKSRKEYYDTCQKLEKAIHNAKLEFSHKVEQTLKNNPRLCWQGIKSITGEKSDKKLPTILCSPDSADRLNLFYSRFDTTDYRNEQKACKDKIQSCILQESSKILSVNEHDIVKIISQININKAAGPDGIHGTVLKACKYQLLDVIKYIFDKSLNEMCFPSIWKMSKIIPVPKKDNPIVDNDLRPVALTSVLSKCFEKIVLNIMLEEIGLHTDNNQFAYKKGRSTSDAVLSLTHHVHKHLNTSPSNYARVLYLDFSSAFNTIQSHVLVNALPSFGISAKLQMLILDYLTERKQYVQVKESLSGVRTINTGSPQGCVLSPVLFTLYTDGLRSSDYSCQILKYADDTVIIGLINGNDESIYRNKCNEIVDWCDKNFLTLNVSKTKETIFTNRKECQFQGLKLKENYVELVSEYKYLGCIIDKDLRWSSHINFVTKKVSTRMACLRKLKNAGISRNILKVVFTSYIRSVMLYCLECWWTSSSSKDRQKLMRTDKMGMKIAKCTSKDVDSLQSIYGMKALKIVQSITKDTSHPLHGEVTFLKHGKRLNIPLCRTTKFKNSALIQAIIGFNNLS
jgi:hypothetical protein